MLMVNDNVCLWTTILQSSVTYTVAVEGLRFYIITFSSNVNICIMLVTCHLFLGRSTSSHTLSPAVFHNPSSPASLSPHFCFAFTTFSTASCFRACLTSSFLYRRIDCEQWRSRINQSTTDCRTFRPRRPSSAAYKTVLYAADEGLRGRKEQNNMIIMKSYIKTAGRKYQIEVYDQA